MTFVVSFTYLLIKYYPKFKKNLSISSSNILLSLLIFVLLDWAKQ